jgi:hypothetical protein
MNPVNLTMKRTLTATAALAADALAPAMDAKTASEVRRNERSNFDQEALAMLRNNPTPLDRDPKTWQPVSAELRLPPHTDFLLLRLDVAHSTASQRCVTFYGHYLDDMRLTLGRRAPLP